MDINIVTIQPSAYAVPPSGASFHPGIPLSLRWVWCLLVLSKNVGTYEPSFGSLCTVTFLAKRERVPANTSPPQGQKGARMGLMPEGKTAYAEGCAVAKLLRKNKIVVDTCGRI